MKIALAEVEHVAHLARLSFPPEQIETFIRQLNAILTYVAKLEELDTTTVEPTTHALALTNAFRQDEVLPSIPEDDALNNAPKREQGAFAVPRII